MNKLYVHIGAPKTGTSAIQNFLSSNDIILKKIGYTCFNEFNHWHLFSALSKRNSGPNDISISKILSACANSKFDNGIFSTEMLSFAPNSQIFTNNLSMLFEGLKKQHIEINIVSVLRDPFVYLLSAYGEDVISGKCPLTFLGWLGTPQGVGHSCIIKTIGLWEKCFPDLIHKKFIYEENSKHANSLIKLFSLYFDIENQDCAFNENANLNSRVSFSADQIEAVRRHNCNFASTWSVPIYTGDNYSKYYNIFMSCKIPFNNNTDNGAGNSDHVNEIIYNIQAGTILKDMYSQFVMFHFTGKSKPIVPSSLKEIVNKHIHRIAFSETRVNAYMNIISTQLYR